MNEEAAGIFYEYIRQKSKTRPKVPVGKFRPKRIVLPPDTGPLLWWREARPIVWVDIVSGRVLVFRWPLE